MERNLDNLHARAEERRQQRYKLRAAPETHGHERRQLLEWFAELPTHSLREFKTAIIAARGARQRVNAKGARMALARKRLEAKKNKNKP